jgi:hypothetical protein
MKLIQTLLIRRRSLNPRLNNINQSTSPGGSTLTVISTLRSAAIVVAGVAVSLMLVASQAQAANGPLVSWGGNIFREVSDTPSGSFSAVAAGLSHSVGLRTDRTLLSWGDDSFGQVSGTPSGTFSAVAAGGYHSVGLRTDGTLVAWGFDNEGQVSQTPSGTFSVVAAGSSHNVAIQSVNHAPRASCHNVTVFADETCTANASIDNGSFDPDVADTITVIQSPAGPYPLGETLVTLTVTDSQGESSSGQATVTVLDGTPPLIACPANIIATASSTAGASVSYPLPTASDSCSAFDVACSPASGSLFPLGANQVTCTATDTAGNHSQCSFTVCVVYSWSGVLQPINADGSSVFRAGSTVPVKFQLTGASAGINNAVARLSYAKVSNNTPGPVNEADAPGNATVGNLFQYDTTSGKYTFNWSTKGMTAGQYRLTIDLGDGVTRVIVVYLR